MKRKVIQIASAGVSATNETQTVHMLHALCDDGTVWMARLVSIYEGDPSPWVRLPDIPQDDDQARAAEEE